jgi:hypothetical protein
MLLCEIPQPVHNWLYWTEREESSVLDPSSIRGMSPPPSGFLAISPLRFRMSLVERLKVKRIMYVRVLLRPLMHFLVVEVLD